MPTVVLRPMTARSFQRFLDHMMPHYAAEKVRSGEWDQAGAQARAEGEYRMLLPQGQDTPDNVLYDLHDPGLGQDVGVLWYALRTRGGERSAFVYEVLVYEAFRRQGYATLAFGLVAQDAAGRGARSLGLHVFGHNTGARALYQSLGFEETSVLMSRPL